MSRFRFLLSALLASVLLACASAPGGGSASTSGPITAEEIASANVPNAYEAVSRLRNAWFRDRSGGGAVTPAPLVFVGETRQINGVSDLRNFRAQEIAEIRFVRGAEAVNRWGMDGRGGAIFVVLR